MKNKDYMIFHLSAPLTISIEEFMKTLPKDMDIKFGGSNNRIQGRIKKEDLDVFQNYLKNFLIGDNNAL